MAPSFEIDPQIQHHFSDGVYAKQMFLPKGYVAYSHKHPYSHLAILGKGKVAITIDNETTMHSAPACIDIKAGAVHEIAALADTVWYCIHATQETDPDKIDKIAIGT